MKLLQAVKQHWSVMFLKYVASYLDDSVGANADEVLVERCVMKLAQRKAVRNSWFSAFLITYDVRRVEKFTVPQSTNRALGPVGAKNALAKRALVKAYLYNSSCVSASFLPDLIRYRRRRRRTLFKVEQGSIVELNREGECGRVISDDEYWPYRQVASFYEPKEIDQRNLSAHEFAESSIVPMVGIGAPIRVEKASVTACAVIIWPVDRGTYRERQLAHFRLEYPLHAYDGNPKAIELEAVL